MTVTQIAAVPGSKSRYRVELDGEFAFVLYQREIRAWQLEEGSRISSDTLEEINGVLSKRARLRAMHLLETMDRTEENLRAKLVDSGYSAAAVEDALTYVKSFGYVNDEAYARRFVEGKKGQKSRREIQALLQRRGLTREQADSALEDYTSQDAVEAIRRLAEKKHFDPATADWKEKQRLYAYLARKGFRCEDIRQVIQVCDCDA